MRRDDQAIDLLIAVVGERKHRPVLAGLTGAPLKAADNAVSPGRGRNLDAVRVSALIFDGIGQIDGRGVGPHIDGFDGMSGRNANKHRRSNGERGTQKCQESTSNAAGSRRRSRPDSHMSPETIATRLCAEFAATGALRSSSSQDPCAM